MPFWKKDLFTKVRDGGVKVSLCDCDIGNEGAKEVARALSDPKTKCRKLKLGFNDIGDEGAKAIAMALGRNTTLEELLLDANKIQDEGAKAIAKALETNTTLTSLALDCNLLIGDEGATAIAMALMSNSSLTTLDLRVTNIGDEGATIIAMALRSNKTLTVLNLLGTDIGDEGAKAIATALHSNKTLTELNLLGTNIGDAAMTRIETLLKPENRQRRAEETVEHEKEERNHMGIDTINDMIRLDMMNAFKEEIEEKESEEGHFVGRYSEPGFGDIEDPQARDIDGVHSQDDPQTIDEDSVSTVISWSEIRSWWSEMLSFPHALYFLPGILVSFILTATLLALCSPLLCCVALCHIADLMKEIRLFFWRKKNAGKLFYDLGGGYLEEPMRSGAIALLNADWLIQFAKSDHGHRLPPRQQLPPEAFVSFESLVQRSQPCQHDWMEHGGFHVRTLVLDDDSDKRHMGMKVIALSYMWLSKEHPDPTGTTLKIVAQALQTFIYDDIEDNDGVRTREFLGGWGVFWDYGSLYQHPNPGEGIYRTDKEDMLFKEGLKIMPWFYHHDHTIVFQMTELPDTSIDNADTNRTHYLERGWTFFEHCLASLGKPTENCIDVSKLVSCKTTQYLELNLLGSWSREQVPILPFRFEQQVQCLKFTNGRDDRKLVTELYYWRFMASFSYAIVLDYSNRGWTDVHGEYLLEILRSKAMPRLEELNLGFNKLSFNFFERLVETLENTPRLHTIEAHNNGHDLTSLVPLFQLKECKLI